MFAVKAQITKCLDDTGNPTFVECQFVDGHGHIQIFEGKDAYFTVENLDRNSIYPLPGVVGCEILERGNQLVKITTGFPWGIVSTKDEIIFEVSSEQLLEFEHLE